MASENSTSQQNFEQKLKGLDLLLLRLIIIFEEDEEEAVDVEDGEDIPVELSVLIDTGVDGEDLPISHKAVVDEIV